MRLCVLTSCILLLLPGLPVSAAVTGSQGDTLVLPCTYHAHKYPYSMCWGQGSCPVSKCSKAIMWTNGTKVTWRHSDRYQLMGNITQGDVSLTISKATSSDRGTYCCRVEIPGLFNDLKKEIAIEINEATVDFEENLILVTPGTGVVLIPKIAELQMETTTITQENEVTEDLDSDYKPGKGYPVTTIIRIAILFSIISLMFLIYKCT